jgi:hypothetical protein
MKEYIHQTSCKTVVNKLQRIGIESIHIKWMNEIIKDYICQTSCKIIVNKLQNVLTYSIHWQLDEKPCWHFIHHVGILFVTLECAWKSNVEISCKKLHIVACELHHIYDIVYNIRCPLQLLQLLQLVH